MTAAFDINTMARDAAAMILTHHIRARLAQKGCVLRRGSPEGTAKFLVKRWGDANVRAFYAHATNKERWLSHAKLASDLGVSAKSVRDFCRRTLRELAIVGRPADGSSAERIEIDLFRRGSELFWSDLGVKLQVNTEMLPFHMGRRVTDSQLGSAAATRLNYEGACAAQEADTSQPEEVRSAGRAALEERLKEPEPRSDQGKLFSSGEAPR